MPARFDAYRMTDGKTPLSARYFNPVWQDLDLRLVELEALRVGWLEAVSQVSNLGLARINELVGAPMTTVNEAIATLQQSLAELPNVVLAGELDTALQAEAQARALLAQQITALQQAIEDVSGGDPFPPMAGQAGKVLTTDGDPTTEALVIALWRTRHAAARGCQRLRVQQHEQRVRDQGEQQPVQGVTAAEGRDDEHPCRPQQVDELRKRRLATAQRARHARIGRRPKPGGKACGVHRVGRPGPVACMLLRRHAVHPIATVTHSA